MAKRAASCSTGSFERYQNPVGFALRKFFVERRNIDPTLDERRVIAMIAAEIDASAYTIRRWARQGSINTNVTTVAAANAFARLVGVPLEAMQIPRSRPAKK